MRIGYEAAPITGNVDNHYYDVSWEELPPHRRAESVARTCAILCAIFGQITIEGIERLDVDKARQALHTAYHALVAAEEFAANIVGVKVSCTEREVVLGGLRALGGELCAFEGSCAHNCYECDQFEPAPKLVKEDNVEDDNDIVLDVTARPEEDDGLSVDATEFFEAVDELKKTAKIIKGARVWIHSSG